MKEIEVDKETFKALWKSNKEKIKAEVKNDELLKIKTDNQWLVCEPTEEGKNDKIEIEIILAKYEPY